VIDDFCKQLVARHPASAPGPTPDWQLLDRELSSEPLHADSVVLLPTNPGQTAAPILHLEFQTRPDPRWPIRQVVLHLKLFAWR
jgi:hypothetical protein